MLPKKLKNLFVPRQSQTKNQSQTFLSQDQEEISKFENLVFVEKNGQIYIGGELVTQQMRSLLRDQAKQLQSSNLYEIINATAINESFNLFTQAGNMEHVQYAKALIYWNKVMTKMINALVK